MKKEVFTVSDTKDILMRIKSYDEYTYLHSLRVSNYAKILAEKIGLCKEKVELIEASALIHDIGKIHIPLSIIRGHDKLAAEERLIINSHPEEGVKYLKARYKYIPDIFINAVLQHHERVDGTGYPYGIKDEQIGIEASIISVADVYDALTSERTYKKKMPKDQVMRYFVFEARNEFNKEVIEVLIKTDLRIKEMVGLL